MRSTLSLTLATLAMSAPGAAHPQGIAFVQAPEQATGMAMGATPAEAFAAATEACVAAGALAEDCLPTNWCQPAGWSIDLFVQHQEGIHWHEVHCGLPDVHLARQLADTLCDPKARPWLIVCTLVQMHDPGGRPMID